MNAPATTKGALATLGMEALDRDRVGQVQVSTVAGGVSFGSALEVMEFAKLMSVSQTAVPKHLRNNPGQCLAVTFQAVEWRMSPFAVANKSYEVNDRIAYESQLLHAVVEARASLRERLNCAYTGEGPTRQCTVTGHFIGDSEPRTYTTPMHKDIRVKNSPLWKDDPDQQLFYYASRSWARKWAPDVLLGIYTREELADAPDLGREEEPTIDLHARLAAGSSTTDEGHKGGVHIEGELANIGAGGPATIKPADTKVDPEKPAGNKRTRKKAAAAEAPDKPDAEQDAVHETGSAEQSQPENAAPAEPTTEAEYVAYAEGWIDRSNDKDDAEARWDGERDLQKKIGVSLKARNKLRDRLAARCG